ncbi:PTS system mannose/fructose/sorbose family transporter subunit IID [Bacillus salipaludis]|uniref:PTS system mannose/fructose/sorbose family transporter subunit IID n=1 Tax=Bacillus salipaludis TaxID=2547811 RepID=A0ABW8RM65_9BACI
MAENTLINESDELKIDKKDMLKVYWRSFFIMSTINYERFQSLGFAYCMAPLIKKLYKSEEDRAKALTRHMEMYNSNHMMGNLILGVTTVLEEQNAANGNKMEKAVSSVKVGLMGPLAGIGDSLLFGTIRPILGGVAGAMAIKGNILGPILFLVLWNIMNFGFRYWSLMYGRNTGMGLLRQIKESNLVQKISEGASVLGLLVLGVLVADWVNISIPIKYKAGNETQSVQDILDSIMPGMLPLLATVLMIFLLKRNISPGKIIIGVFIISFLLGGPGILTNG